MGVRVPESLKLQQKENKKELMPEAHWRTYNLPETYVKCMCGWTGYFTQTKYYECSNCKKLYEIDSKINFKKISKKRYDELYSAHFQFKWDWTIPNYPLFSKRDLSKIDKLKEKEKHYKEFKDKMINIYTDMTLNGDHSELTRIQYMKSIENIIVKLDEKLKEYDN